MNKLITTAIAMLTAIVAQASAVNWGLSGNIDAEKYASGTAYLICVDNMAKPTLTADTASDWYKTNGGLLASKAFRSATVTGGAVSESEDIAQAIGRKNYWLIIVNDAETDMAVSTVTKALNITTGSLSQTASWTASTQMTSFATTSVPEPTSGLMLLLGIAGLALKRKRA